MQTRAVFAGVGRLTLAVCVMLTLGAAQRARAQEEVEPVEGETIPEATEESAPIVKITPPSGALRAMAATCPPPDGTRPDPALVNTDPFVLARFGLKRVYEQLLKRAHVVGPSATTLYQQMWDSMDAASAAKFRAPHCDDNQSSINGFPVECPRPETALKDTRPNMFVPVALTNRFDLSPSDGANCGEYRIIYAMTPFDPSNRNLMILEGVLPNPKPGCGLDACRPVVNFWRDLSTLDVSTARGQRELAARMERFYFTGISGFSPVIHPNHYGMQGRGGYGGVNGGQIRTNMFVSGTTWQMREFKLARRCRHGRCRLLFEPSALGENPFPPLFNERAAAPDARAADFLASFPDQTQNLITDEVNLITLNTDPRFNAGQSTSSNIEDDYVGQAIAGLSAEGRSELTTSIRAELTALGREHVSTLDVVQRAMTQSCAGCHMLARNAPLSDDGRSGPFWPDVRPDGFVHIDENGFLSPGLWCAFLPFRRTVLDGFAASPATACTHNDGKPGHRCVVTRRQTLPSSSHLPLTVAGKLFAPN
ncbi:MAG TPA: hypothetical protein VFN67_17255 [Polyangiales bacterium]|nr:hypothetical protein [Polyangiales bacterium]